jgi:UDP-N-acetylmuramoyl-tripeptide--D-alanyl-D-alanine ligase
MRILEEILKNRKLPIPDGLTIRNVVMDSRKIEENSVFFAINNGNDYVKDALNRGASLVIGDRQTGMEDPRILYVEDTVDFMQDLAREYRKALGLKVVAITGSNGKTTTKDILYSILSTKYKVKKSEGNHNNAIGLPFTLLCLEEDDGIVVLEMGMSAIGEIDRLCGVALPDCGIITNIGDSHLEFLKTRDNVFRAKKELAQYVTPENLILCGDDPYLATLDGEKAGFAESNDIRIEDYREENDFIDFDLVQKGKIHAYRMPLNGRHNCVNGALAIAAALKFKVPQKQIEKALLHIKITPMRFEKIEKNGILYINDAYNASPLSMRCSLDAFGGLYPDYEKIAVLGDMLELGGSEVDFHKDLLREEAEKNLFKLYIFGPRMRRAFDMLGESLREKIRYFSSKEDIRKAVEKEKTNFPKLAVFVKGSRGMKMEEIIG